jgi:Polyketide cyclase / dehydrase and lipid transport
MAALSESVLVGVSLKEAWDWYFEPSGWPLWVDGFATVESSEGYPAAAGSLVWQSVPAGRGTVRERVLAHEPRTLHKVAFTDPESAGELTTRFEAEGGGTRVTLELEYRLARGGALAWVTDRVFVRSQMRESLRRTLARYRLEVESR